MEPVTVTRRLVKSPPELWAEVSEETSLERHLDPLGPIRVTRAEPETTVAWEGESARGTVEIEGSAWGTKVTLTAEIPEPLAVAVAEPEPEPAEEPEPAPVEEPEPVAVEEPVAVDEPVEEEPETPKRGFFARLFGRRPPEPAVVVEPEPEVVAEPEPEPEPVLVAVPEPEPEPLPATPTRAETLAALEAGLDSLGAAHHRPFSRG